MGGGSKSQNQSLRWDQYVPQNVRQAQRRILPQMEAKVDTGLSTEERQQYQGDMLTGLGSAYKAQLDALWRAISQSGEGGADSGAALKARTDIGGGNMAALSSAIGDIMKSDLQRKDINTERFLQMLMTNYQPIQSGVTRTQTPGLGEYMAAIQSLI
jgi:hypothetical protein